MLSVRSSMAVGQGRYACKDADCEVGSGTCLESALGKNAIVLVP